MYGAAMSLRALRHPAVRAWFEAEFAAPTACQAKAWPEVRGGGHTLIAAPTGSGKTLAAFLAVIDELAEEARRGLLDDAVRVVYVSPLKALSYDIERNLEAPLRGIAEWAERLGEPPVAIRAMVRTGDTPPAARQAMARQPPHILVTTPESLHILLTSESGRTSLARTRTVIVDEIHAVAGNKRGAHLALTLERLEALRAGEIGASSGHGANGTNTEPATGEAAGEPARGAGRGANGAAPGGSPHATGPAPRQAAQRTLPFEGTAMGGAGDVAGPGARDANPGTAAASEAIPCDSPARENPATREARTPLHAGGPSGLRRIGLSATQRPMELIARFLVGNRDDAPCAIIDEGFHRRRDLALELPSSPLEPVMATEVWDEVYDRIAALAREHRTTLVFANTRRLAERAARALAERLGEKEVASHHGSLSRERRFEAEQRLKSGTLTLLVATASLELGIDIGDVDLVCQLGTTRNIATFLQRVGRSGHGIEATPKGRLFPLSRDDLVECAALFDAVRRGELDTLSLSEQPLDVLAQQIVAEVSGREWETGELLALVRRAWPYRDLEPQAFESVVDMLASGFTTRRGRRGAFVHWDRVNGRLRARRGARMAALTNAGTIPENADYAVVLEPSGTVIGTLNEDFAIETLPGDIFQLGLHSWRILRVESDRIRVEDAGGQPPTIPFWIGEAPARTDALSGAVSRLRETVGRLVAGGDGLADGIERAVGWATGEAGLPEEAARQLVDYLAAGQAALGVMPSAEHLVIERFFDESGGMQLVIHSPVGGRVNRAFGLALRKRFCRRFNFELQAAATEDNIVLSLGETHSFPLDEVPGYLASASARDVLVQALLDAPLFNVRWRWNANVSLAVPRRAGGRKVPAPIQRMQAEDLVAVVFPDQIACAENLGAGEREIPDHPLVRQTVHDALHEAMDVDGLVALLARIEGGEVAVHARDLPEPSPFAHEILNAKPYAFLDDAPLEERRTRAVSARRWLDPASAADLGRLDPEAIERVREEAWPDTDGADALHDALVMLGFLTEREMRVALGVPGAPGVTGTAHVSGALPGTGPNPEATGDSLESALVRTEPLATLVGERRAGRLAGMDAGDSALVDPGAGGAETIRSKAGGAGGMTSLGASPLWVAAERVLDVQVVRPDGGLDLAPAPGTTPPASPDDALRELVRGRLGGLGPVTATALAADIGIDPRPVRAALAALENEGFVLRGDFTGGGHRGVSDAANPPDADLDPGGERAPRPEHKPETEPEPEWCERRLLARIHRYTLARLRREIDPVEPADYMRFLFAWHGLEERREGPAGLLAIIEQLEGFEAPAAVWEDSIFAARLRGYDSSWLDTVCLTGRVVWFRRTGSSAPRAGTTTATRVAFIDRRHLAAWRPADGNEDPEALAAMSSRARRVREILRTGGAQFFDDLRVQSGLLATQVEDALAELVAGGHVTADGYAGLRALVRRNRRTGGGPRRRMDPFGDAGRWCLVDSRLPPDHAAPAEPLDRIADVLLRRYGVVFRKVLEREAGLPPWRDLVRVLRRREDRGEVRGGRFVNRFSGEQFALPEAVGELRRIRRAAPGGRILTLSAADPLNLTGIVTPGERVSSTAAREVVYRDGEPDGDALPAVSRRRASRRTGTRARWTSATVR